MAIIKLNIEDFLTKNNGRLLLDVRSPAEYTHANIPGAVNIPLFTNEERAVVGTAYKQKSREQAIKIGLDYFGPKMRKIVEEVENILASQNTNNSNQDNGEVNSVFIYCWRGGMRSAAIAWLLDLYGHKVFTLIGGYKKFRNLVIETLSQSHQLFILGGYTGSGKTEVLIEMEKGGETVINLEQIANHKGSAFGNIGLPKQPSQEMFENLLALEFRSKSRSFDGRIWMEDESQRIGQVNIPPALWSTMRNSPIHFLDIDFEARLDHITEEYGQLNRDQMIGAIDRISKRLGGVEAKNAIEHLMMGKTRESFRILLTYYDRWYLKALHNREGLNSLLTKVKCDTVTPSNAKKLLPHPEYHEKP